VFFLYVIVIIYLRVSLGAIFIFLLMPTIVAFSSIFIDSVNTSDKSTSSELLSMSYSMAFFINIGFFMALVAGPTIDHLSYTSVQFQFYFIR
jgi:hypothetical protein